MRTEHILIIGLIVLLALSMLNSTLETLDNRKRIRDMYRPKRKPRRNKPRRHPRRRKEWKPFPPLPDWMDPKSGVMPPVITTPELNPNPYGPIPPPNPDNPDPDPDEWGDPSLGPRIL